MIRTGTLEKARVERRHHILPNGTGYWRNGLIASPPEEPVSPQAFLVEQDPGTVIEPHFHLENEFQVMVAGNGSLGRHAVEPVSVHYAGAHTGYGPITAGSDGLHYFTLRSRMDSGAQFLPGARDKMQRIPKRHRLGNPVRPSQASELAARREPEVVTVLEPDTDGIAAWMLRIPAGRTSAAPVHPGGGRFLLVIGGLLELNGEPLPRLSTAFVSADESVPPLRSGREGLEVLVLQFPR
jgi:redox-sensitive bicupin YhaK (pirin superfamily)